MELILLYAAIKQISNINETVCLCGMCARESDGIKCDCTTNESDSILGDGRIAYLGYHQKILIYGAESEKDYLSCEACGIDVVSVFARIIQSRQ